MTKSQNVVEIKVYTDGSADNMEQKVGGIGVYFTNAEFKHLNMSKRYRIECCTNQKMELLACIKAIEAVADHMSGRCKLWSLHIFSDSMYTINSIETYAPKWIQYGWKRVVSGKCEEVKNLKYIKKLYALYSMYNIKFTHVRSHKKEPKKGTEEWNHWYGNDKADKFAKKAVKK